MHFDRWDILAAYYNYAILWSPDSYTSAIQRRLEKLQYRPCTSEQHLGGSPENAQEIYLQLVKRHQSASAYEHECKLMAINFEEI